MSHSPSLRRNGGSSFGAEFHNGLGMSLMSVSSVVLFVDPSYVQRYAHIHVHNTYTYKQVHVTGPARYFGVPVLHNSTADSVERDTGSTYPSGTPDIVLVEVPVPVTEALRNAKELSLSFVNGPLRSGFGNRYRYR